MDKMQEKHYEELFNQLLERGRVLHTSNKKRIRIGMFTLAVFTITMILIRLATDSDRATFLIVWVIGMFAISIYLVGIEYIDNSIEKTLEEVTEREADWDDLIPDSESVRGIMQDRIDDRLEERRERLNERRSELQERYRSLRESAERGKVAEEPEETEQMENVSEPSADNEEGSEKTAPESGDEV